MTRKQLKQKLDECRDEIQMLNARAILREDKIKLLTELNISIREERARMEDELKMAKLRNEFLTEKVRELLRRQVEQIEDLSDGALD